MKQYIVQQQKKVVELSMVYKLFQLLNIINLINVHKLFLLQIIDHQ